ncbi:MAG: HpcH/HpaI aldolase family protein [Pseudonocardiaceae bacterium]
MTRLNRVIDLLADGETVFGGFLAPDPTAAFGAREVGYDALIFEAEHKPWDVPLLKDAFQYLLDRRQIFEGESITPAATPLVRVPANGGERSQWHAKQALDLGAFGIIWPHVDTVEDARNAVAACRYPRLGRPAGEPAGLRGDSPAWAARYWGVTTAEYYERADVWPLAPYGELLVGLMIESVEAVENLDAMLDQVPGIGLVLIGEGDLSQELGVPRQYEHPTVLEHKDRVLEVCAKHGVAVGHPHVTEKNLEQVIEQGYRLLLTAPVVRHPALDRGRNLAGR